jgi:hypothetical protein
MPEAAVDKNDLSMPRKDHVGLARQLLDMDPKSKTHRVEKGAHNQFGASVLSADL